MIIKFIDWLFHKIMETPRIANICHIGFFFNPEHLFLFPKYYLFKYYEQFLSYGKKVLAFYWHYQAG